MYTFLMADDEEIVRRGFRRKIDWKRIGFRFLEPCADGREAIEAIDRLRPDVLMTDIYMPHVDGLAVAQYAAEHSPSTLVVILSGYDEFEFAQRAMRTRAVDYVLKPVNSRELTQLLLRLRERLDTEQRTREEMHTRAEAGDALVRTRTLVDLVTPGAAPVPSAVFETLFGFSPRGLACAALVAERESIPREKTPSWEPLDTVLRTAAVSGPRALSFFPGDDRAAVLVFQAGLEACERQCRSLASRLAAAGWSGVAVGVGGARADWTEACRSYEEAGAALSYRLVRSGGGVFSVGPTREDPAALAAAKRTMEVLCRSVLSGETTEAARGADTMLRGLDEAGLTPARVRHEVSALFDALHDGFGALGISRATLAQDLGEEYERGVDRLRSAEQVRDRLARCAEYARTILTKRNLPAARWKSLDVQEYVARHFAEKDLSVQRVAGGLSISTSYLSKLVKRYFDASFVEYLTSYRMEKACRMLATTDLLAYEVAEAVGFADPRYFSALFKRHTGRTPTEFRAEARRKVGQG
jgi:two-component system, response regulator YesN